MWWFFQRPPQDAVLTRVFTQNARQSAANVQLSGRIYYENTRHKLVEPVS
jgi:hypothetical protein